MMLYLVVLVQMGCIKKKIHSENQKKENGDKMYSVVEIPAGTFMMGCTFEQEDDCGHLEKSAHQVTISKDFYLMKTEVTQALYERVMGENPSNMLGSNRPVDNVSWYDAVKFCNTLSKMEGLEQCYTINGEEVSWSNKSCNGWRLPTEAEWEYAARGGQSYKYAGSDNIDEVGWYYLNSGSETHPVGLKRPNGFGLYDMSGNAYEWVWNWYGDYSSQKKIDFVGPDSGHYRVFRGGGWHGVAWVARVSDRESTTPDYMSSRLGFRAGRNP